MSEFEYASAPESRAIAKIAASYDLFIGGKFVKAKYGKLNDFVKARLHY